MGSPAFRISPRLSNFIPPVSGKTRLYIMAIWSKIKVEQQLPQLVLFC
jgi:hypothetical protein